MGVPWGRQGAWEGMQECLGTGGSRWAGCEEPRGSRSAECWGPQRARRGEPGKLWRRTLGVGVMGGGLEQLRGEEGEREGGRNPSGNQERKRGVRTLQLSKGQR